jgi:hypothetical protein
MRRSQLIRSLPEGFTWSKTTRASAPPASRRRERAYDETVLQSRSEAGVCAEGILNVHKFYDFSRKLLLSTAGLVAVAWSGAASYLLCRTEWAGP